MGKIISEPLKLNTTLSDKEILEVAIKYGTLDVDGIIDWIKAEDGRGGRLAGYDGIENEQDNYFIYRTN